MKFFESSSAKTSELQQQLPNALQINRSTEQLAFVIPIASSPEQVFVAYEIPYCALCLRTWLGVLGGKNGRAEILASLDNPVPNQTLTVIPLHNGDNANLSFLAYGTKLGDAHSRLSAIVYCFCNGKLTELWSRSGLPQGTLSMVDERLTLSFLTSLQPPWRYQTDT